MAGAGKRRNKRDAQRSRAEASARNAGLSEGGDGAADAGQSAPPADTMISQGGDGAADVEESTRRPDATLRQGGRDIDITSLEDNWVTNSKKRQTENPKKLPFRPAFSNDGKSVNLLANYFALTVEAKPLWKYTLKVTPTDCADWVPEEKDKKQAKGYQLKEIIRMALATLSPNNPGPIATEYKQQVVTVEKLKLPEDGIIREELSDPVKGKKMWDVNFHTASGGPESIDIDGLLEWLQSMRNLGNESVFPAYQGEIDALNVILGHTARTDTNVSSIGSRFFAVGKNKDAFSDPGWNTKKKDLEKEDLKKDDQGSEALREGKFEILRGYIQSVRPATGRLLLNAQVTASKFRASGSLHDLFTDWGVKKMIKVVNEKKKNRKVIEINELQLKDIHRLLSQARVEVNFPKPGTNEDDWAYRSVLGLSAREDDPRKYHTPKTAQFVPKLPGGEPGQSVTVAQHYKQKYNKIIDTDMPVIDIGRKPEEGKDRNPVYIPAEHIRLALGQPYKRLLPDVSREMIRFAVQPPKANKDFICGPGRVVLNLDNSNLLPKFGITVGNRLVSVPGRELPAPKLTYGNEDPNEKHENPKFGVWNLTGKEVAVSGKEILRWAYMHSFKDGSRVRAEIDALVKAMKNMGININETPTDACYEPEFTNGAIAKVFSELDKLKPQLQLLLVVLPNDDASVYNWVKQKGDIEYGIHTVCLLQGKFIGARPDYCANVGLKVNLKFRGVNHRLENPHELISNGKTMFVGYDVTHPTNLGTSSSPDASSMAGLVASMDLELSQWPAWTWSVPSKEEMVDKGLRAKFKACLDHWKTWERYPRGGPQMSMPNQRRALPDNIIIYRDGVSEGQFTQVLEKELPEIRAACKNSYPAKKPRLTIIVSVKRHSTRFYPEKPDDGKPGDKKDNGNPKAGTVVDRGVTSVRYWDFFMQAHKAITGTARPARYTVLLDEVIREAASKQMNTGTNPAAELEKLTLQLCYLFGRATRSVSICPPAYYADLICTRARRHNSGLFEETDETPTTGSESTVAVIQKVHENLKGDMYYI